MKKISMKIIALCLCVMLAVSGITATAFAMNSDGDEAENKETAAETAVAEDEASADISKDETVYVLAGADGSAKKIIVSDWLKNSLGSDTLSDKSELTDIENVKGDESYSVNGGEMIWNAEGGDIYYQGSTEKDLPVDMSVTYTLDGEPISANDLAGKSGRVTIRFDYNNKQYETVEIDGEQEKIYVPFAMLSCVILDDDVFTNVTVTNGKLINDGGRTVVIGTAFPGLKENLAISEDKLKIPDYVEISADAKEFKLGNTVTVATNELFNGLDTDKFSSITKLSDSVKQLPSAMAQLLDGSSQLYDGLNELLEKSGDLAAGIDQLAAGSENLKSGAESLDSGAEELQAGATQLSEGLNTLTASNDVLNGGAKQVFDTLLSTANTQLAAAGLEVPTLTVENYGQILDGVIAKSGGSTSEAAKPIVALKSSLDSYNTFYLGLQSYTAGVADAAAGANALKAGTDNLKTGASRLSAGASELDSGILDLKNATPALADGISQLRDGSMQLSDGLNEFNEQGIQKLADAMGGNLDGLMTRFRATKDVSLRYKNFAGASEDTDGQVKFVYRTEAVE